MTRPKSMTRPRAKTMLFIALAYVSYICAAGALALEVDADASK